MENETVSYKADVIDDKIYKIECDQCRRKTNHTVRKSFRESWCVENEGLAGVSDYTIVQCNGCDILHFCKISSCNDDIEPVFDNKGNIIGTEYPDTITSYPQITLKYETKLNYRSTPQTVKSIYNETFTALESGLDRLSSTGIRGVLEQICLDKSVPKYLRLNKKIDKLYELQIINNDMKMLLHKIRLFGNTGTHESEGITKADLQNAWASLNSLIRYIYGTEDQKNYFIKKNNNCLPF